MMAQTIIVDDYMAMTSFSQSTACLCLCIQELCKVAVLEQQNASQTQLQEALEKEQEKWQELIKVQVMLMPVLTK